MAAAGPSFTADATVSIKGESENPLSNTGSRFANLETLFQVVVQDLPIQMTNQMDWGIGSGVAFFGSYGSILDSGHGRFHKGESETLSWNCF